jgi:hypothetical protein
MRSRCSSTVASWGTGELAIQSWLAVAPLLGLTFLLLELAVAEVQTLQPQETGVIDELVTTQQQGSRSRPEAAQRGECDGADQRPPAHMGVTA